MSPVSSRKSGMDRNQKSSSTDLIEAVAILCGWYFLVHLLNLFPHNRIAQTIVVILGTAATGFFADKVSAVVVAIATMLIAIVYFAQTGAINQVYP
jgi:hypothetical protein